jgi:uncharacterized protein with PQ loop repeat
MPLASLVGWGGAAVGTLTTLTQAVRVRRVGADGVSATTWSFFTLLSGFWLAYGVAVRSNEIVVAAAVGAPVLVGMLAQLDPAARRRGLARAALAVGLVAWLPAGLLGWNAGLLGVGGLIVATRLPQLVQLVRARHARGVSTWSWALGSASLCLWLAYYVATSRADAAATMAMALCANLAIVALALARHRVAARRVAPPPALAVA